MPSSPAELPALFAFDPEEDFVLLAGDGFPSRLGLSLDEDEKSTLFSVGKA